MPRCPAMNVSVTRTMPETHGRRVESGTHPGRAGKLDRFLRACRHVQRLGTSMVPRLPTGLFCGVGTLGKSSDRSRCPLGTMQRPSCAFSQVQRLVPRACHAPDSFLPYRARIHLRPPRLPRRWLAYLTVAANREGFGAGPVVARMESSRFTHRTRQDTAISNSSRRGPTTRSVASVRSR